MKQIDNFICTEVRGQGKPIWQRYGQSSSYEMGPVDEAKRNSQVIGPDSTRFPLLSRSMARVTYDDIREEK